MNKTPQKRTFGTINEHDNVSHITLPERRRFNLWMSTPDLTWADPVYRQCYPLDGSRKHRLTFGTIMSNLAVSPAPISIFLDKVHYRSIKKKPSDFTPTNISPICSNLEAKGYVTLSKGFSYRGSHAESTTIQPTAKLLEALPPGLSFAIQRDGLIVVKEFEPPPVYPEHVQLSEDVLFRYNPTVEPDNMLYAVYKESFDFDGRFHGSSVICMRKDIRKNLRIDGEATFEADVRNCIPWLLYAQEMASECPGDAYEISSVPRDLAKKAMLISLNCRGRKTSVRALQAAINWEYHGRYKADDILKALELKHHQIDDCLYTGVGRRLMNAESSCMRRFLQEMLDKGIKVYPIYDSVIGKATNKEVIRDALRRSFTINDVPPVIH